jgi:hypothetical protein
MCETKKMSKPAKKKHEKESQMFLSFLWIEFVFDI